ncbi:hypothetical protein GF373_16875 [bacterium]|nr:hypothetical protein [bacterium]
MAVNKPKIKTLTPENLSEAELDVMVCLWNKDELTAKAIREALEPHRPMTHGAAVTLLNRLEAKGMVKKEKGKVGKAFIYKPAQKPTGTYRQILDNLVQRIFRGNSLALVTSLYETHPPTEDEIDQLEEYLESLRAKSEGNQS